MGERHASIRSGRVIGPAAENLRKKEREMEAKAGQLVDIRLMNFMNQHDRDRCAGIIKKQRVLRRLERMIHGAVATVRNARIKKLEGRLAGIADLLSERVPSQADVEEARALAGEEVDGG